MTRLVAISNRISLPRKGVAPGGLAVGVLAAMRAHGGLWIGWSGQVSPSEPGPIEVVATRDEQDLASLLEPGGAQDIASLLEPGGAQEYASQPELRAAQREEGGAGRTRAPLGGE